MHPIAARAIAGDTPIAELVRDFYASGGPLVEAGWEIREAQREMSIRFAEQIDLSMGRAVDVSDEGDEEDGDEEQAAPPITGSIGLIEAPCGVGKGGAYLVPGFLAALGAERRFHGTPNAVKHPAKLMVSTANIALQSQLVRKDIPALGQMLRVKPRATLMKSRQNYVCREAILTEAGSMFGARDQAVQDVYGWTRQPGCDGDRESYPGDASAVWHKVSVGSDECGRQSCPHFDVESGNAAPCFWRQATAAWPRAHIIVGNHHWVALSKGIRVLAYAVDEAHELEAALRGVQGRTLSTSSFLTAGRRGAKALKTDTDPVDRRMTDIASDLFDVIERLIDHRLDHVEETHPSYRSPVPLTAGWCPESAMSRLVQGIASLRTFRDKVTRAALDLPHNAFIDGQVVTKTKEKGDGPKVSRQAANAANKLAELCRIFGAVTLGRPHPDWPSYTSPWAIWAHREKDARDQWRVVVELVPADVAPAFAELYRSHPTMVLASATLPDFTSMRLSLGLGARWTGAEPAKWPSEFATDTGPYAGKVVIRPLGANATPDTAGPTEDDLFAPDSDVPDDPEDEPTSTFMATSTNLAPEPHYERRLPSPYALADMGVIVTPDGVSPRDARWPEWATQQVVEAVKLSGGGALVLATSNAAMRRYAEALRAQNRWTVIRQGETGRSKTIQAFKDEEDSVLVGTRSFFQGLDVQGRSCRLVVIDRIPFASQDDPLENAVGKLLVERAVATDPERARSATSWLLRSVPEASMVLVQGIGRLIRSQDDRGAVVLLDNRINDPGSGWALLRAGLPPFPRSNDLMDVKRVLAGEPLGGVVRTRAPRVTSELSF